MKLPSQSSVRDVIAIGGSAGSFEALRTILHALPNDLPAAVLITTHLGPSVSLLNILARSSALPIKDAVSGESLQSGQVYLAVPDAHLLVHNDHVLVRRGPRENLSRPAIDPLFRSAACAFGSRVIGVILSGSLNDGTAGLAAIKTCGGLAIAQDPADAAVPSMPLSALHAIPVDHCVPAVEMADLLARLVNEPPGTTPDIPADLQFEVAVAAQEMAGMNLNDKLGERSPFTCPDCDGVLWRVEDDRTLRFRCHVGHAVTADILLQQKDSAAETILWRLLRTHEERAALARRLAAQASGPQRETSADFFQKRAAGYEEDASMVRRLLGKTELVAKETG